MKILSFLGMLLGIVLTAISVFVFLSGKDQPGTISAAVLCTTGLIGIYFLVFSFLVSLKQEWKKTGNNFTPMS